VQKLPVHLRVGPCRFASSCEAFLIVRLHRDRKCISTAESYGYPGKQPATKEQGYRFTPSGVGGTTKKWGF
jgi:hypothetical protein